MEIIPAVANDPAVISNAEFVKLTIYNDVNNPGNVSIYTFSSSYREETIDGTVYSPMGGLLQVGIQQRDLRVTSADTSLSLSGIGEDNIYVVLGTKVRGSLVEITRGFYDDNYILTSTAHRFTGIVTSYNITEERRDLVDNFTVTLNASSYLKVLENRIAGRLTNQNSWQNANPLDSSMNNISSISDQFFDFGAPVTKKAATSSQATTEASTVSTGTSSTESGG